MAVDCLTWSTGVRTAVVVRVLITIVITAMVLFAFTYLSMPALMDASGFSAYLNLFVIRPSIVTPYDVAAGPYFCGPSPARAAHHGAHDPDAERKVKMVRPAADGARD